MEDILDILSQAGRSARDLAAIKVGLLRQAAEQNAGPMARGLEEGLIGEGVDMARAGAGALGDAYGAGDGALEKLLSGYHDRMAKARARAAALRAQSPEAFAYGEKLPERVADAAGLIGVAGHARMPELPRIGPGAAPEFAFARTGSEAPVIRMPETGPKPISRAGELLELEQRARHGTHVKNMEKFDLEKIGTGEGAQAYGWGGYFAKDPKKGDWYRTEISKDRNGIDSRLTYNGKSEDQIDRDGDSSLADAMNRLKWILDRPDLYRHDGNINSARNMALAEAEAKASNSNNPDIWKGEIDALRSMSPDRVEFRVPDSGQLYAFEIPENFELLDYDAPIELQPPQVLKRLEDAGLMPKQRYLSDNSGHRLYDEISDRLGDIHSGPKFASEALRAAGIPGLRYLDAGSRDGSAANGTHNFVIWDEARIGKPEPTTLERELQLMAGGE